MIELRENTAMELLHTRFKFCFLDYVILQDQNEYQGEDSHKQAVKEAFAVINNRRWMHWCQMNSLAEEDEDEFLASIEMNEFQYDLNQDKMSASKITIAEFLKLPEDPYYLTKPNLKSRASTIPSPLPYWYAFLEPPYSDDYVLSDFIELNLALFPTQDDQTLEIYRWNDDFSNYFDDGKEWWGTGCWSVYDRTSHTFVVIGASLTD